MKDNVRRAAAFIAGRVCNSASFSSLFDQQAQKNFKFYCDIHGLNFIVFDFSDNCYVKGTCNEGVFSFHHEGEDRHFRCTIKNPNFDGYDFETGKTFSGTVVDHAINLYDHETNKYYTYLF